jgi:hypothetical protein
MTTNRRRPVPRFALCVNTDDPDLLTPRMVYQVVPDDSAAKSDYIRVIDNEGEDYLYPASYFILVDFPPAVGRALLRSAGNAAPGAPRKRITRSRGRSLQLT